MKKYKSLIVVANLLLVLVLFHRAVWQKETILNEGTTLFFELAPVDPRSLMQGDYMQLNYAISGSFYPKSKRGFCVVKKNEKGIAEMVRLQPNVDPLNENEFAVRYNRVDWQTTIGADAYFFQEGKAKRFEKAKFGMIKVDKKGNSVLVGLANTKRKQIK